jgi:hypothetical protein
MSARTVNAEFHCHTFRSADGLIRYDSLLRAARRIGLDAIAITDHDTVEGALEFRRYAQAREPGLHVIIGEERTLEDGSHFIGLFLERAIESRDLAGAIAEIEAQGGLCLVPHPFRRKDGLFRDGLERLKLLEGRPAGFELFSAKSSFAENLRAAELLRASALGPFGGSDAHYECDLGECLNTLAWQGDWKTSVRRMFERQAPFRILGRPQSPDEGGRVYAPWYQRVKEHVRLPKLLVPAARQCYRRYRNWKHGVGPKLLREVYRHA